MMGSRTDHSNSLPARVRFLLKTGLFRSKQAEIPAKASVWVEWLVVVGALVVVAAIAVMVVSRVWRG